MTLINILFVRRIISQTGRFSLNYCYLDTGRIIAAHVSRTRDYLHGYRTLFRNISVSVPNKYLSYIYTKDGDFRVHVFSTVNKGKQTAGPIISLEIAEINHRHIHDEHFQIDAGMLCKIFSEA